jgi:hypothetical protein
MPDIEVRAGFVSELADNGAGITFKPGDPPMALSIGAIPSRMPAGTLISSEIDANEYIVVAVRRSLLQPLNYVLLAYRRPRGEARAANFTLAAWGLVAGVVGFGASMLADTVADGIAGVVASSLVLVPAALRILSVRKAKLLLEAWREPG